MEYNKMCDTASILIRVKEAIKALGRGAQGNMAEKIGIEASAFSRKLKVTPGRRDELTLREFLKIAKFLNIDPSVLINPEFDIEDKNIFREVLKPVIKEILEELESKK